MLSTNVLSHGGPRPNVAAYAGSQPGVLLYYLRLCFWPHPLCLDYEWPIANKWWEIVPQGFVVATLAAAATWGVVRKKAWGFLGACFFLILAPSSSVVPLNQLAFEHRLYLASTAVVALVVFGGFLGGQTLAGYAAIAPRWAKLLGGATAGTVCIAMMFSTGQRNRDYRDDVTIWEDTLRKVPQSVSAYNHLGIALAIRGRFDAAIAQFQKALQIKPDCADAHNNLANALAGRGQLDAALVHYHKALELKPDYVDAHCNLGDVLAARGQLAAAIYEYQKALEITPELANVENHLANALFRCGDFDAAIAHYQKALAINPDHTEARHRLALVRAEQGRIRSEKSKEFRGHHM